MMQNLIEVRGLCKNYPSFSLQDVSFSVPEGSIMGFIGENGAGKTTTIRLILNEIRRDAGKVSLFGLDNMKDEIAAKQQIGAVFDESCFHSDLSAHEVGRILRGIFKSWDDRLYERLLNDFSLPKAKKIKEYSRGMKMKLSIAGAMAHHPRLLILDEATSGLDPVVRSEILDVFLDFIQNEKCGVLFSSHITSDLERVADYVTFIHNGRIVFSRVKDELMENYGVLKCGGGEYGRVEKADVLRFRREPHETAALVADRAAAKRKYPHCVVDTVSLDEIMLFYVKGEKP